METQNYNKKIPSLISDEEVKEFIAIWKEEFGEELTLEQGRMEAEKLMGLIDALSVSQLRNISEPTDERPRRIGFRDSSADDQR